MATAGSLKAVRGEPFIGEHAAWSRSPALRRFWQDAVFDAVSSLMPTGPTLELLTGPGLFAAERPGMLTTDRLPHSGAMAACEPEALPFPSRSFDCIVGLDILCRSARPALVLTEADRVLAARGRLILAEPFSGPLGLLFHRFKKQRPAWPSDDPWFDACKTDYRRIGNAGSAKACLRDRLPELPRHAPALSLTEWRPVGGISEWLAQDPDRPAEKVEAWVRRENHLPHRLHALLATRAIYVLEKAPPPPLDEE
jgi:SAM-dependent methyltransferase